MTVPNPTGEALRHPLHLPRIHLALPDHRSARLRPSRHRLRPRGDWIVESKSLKLYLGLVPQSRRVSRGLHPGDRPAAGRGVDAEMAADRRLLVSARRHPDRRLLSDRRAACRGCGCPTGRCALSRTGLSAPDGRSDPRAIRDRALALGFDAVGFAPAHSAPRRATRLGEFIAARLSRRHGLAGRDRRAARRIRRACGPRRAAWSCSASITRRRATRSAAADQPDRGDVSVYARGRDYHDIMKRRLKALAQLDRAASAGAT